MVLCLRIGTAGLWRLDARWVVTDVSSYRSSFIFNGQLVQESCFWTEDGGTLITEMAGTFYPKTGQQILTSVRYVAQVWIAQSFDNCYVKSHCCCTATSVTVSTDVRTQMSVPERIVWLPAEGNLSFVRGMCQHCSGRCLFYVVVDTVSAGGLYVKSRIALWGITSFSFFSNLSSTGANLIKYVLI